MEVTGNQELQATEQGPAGGQGGVIYLEEEEVRAAPAARMGVGREFPRRRLVQPSPLLPTLKGCISRRKGRRSCFLKKTRAV